MDPGKRRHIPPPTKTFVIEGHEGWGPEEIKKELGLRIVKDLRAGRLELKPLPEAALRLAELARDPDPSINDAVSALQHDPALAERVLKVAASPAMARRPPKDLNEAAMAVGILQLRDMAFAIASGRVFRAPGLDHLIKEEHMHSFAVGLGTAEIFQRMGIGSKQGFLVGMLHDIGALLLYVALSQYARKEPELIEPVFVQRARRILHGALGERLIRSWGLGETVRAGAKYHHSPNTAGALTQVALAVSIADHAAKLEADDANERAEALSQFPALYAAGLGPADAKAIARVVQAAMKENA
ncbi:MAG: HDOD domain-containing protein [Nannocystaceae bacterium]|nr:HDOD domain-containing protein [bacterium]